MSEFEDRLHLLESEIERRLVERFAALRDEFDRLRVETDRRWEGFLSRFDQNFQGIVPAELVTPPVAPAAPAGRTAGMLSIAAARSLDEAANQVDALHRFLDLCREHASRAALLVVRGTSAGVWKAVGFSELGGNDDELRRVVLSLEGDDFFRRVLEGSPLRLPQGNRVSAHLSADDAAEAVLVPMVVKEKISGAVYADCIESRRKEFDPDAIGFLTFLAGLTVDRLASRKLKPAPSLRVAQLVDRVAEPGAEPEPLEPVEPIPETEPALPSISEEPSSSKTIAIEAAAVQPQPAEEKEPTMPELADVEDEPAPPRFGRFPEAPAPEARLSAAPAEPASIDFDSSSPGGAARPPDFETPAPVRPSVSTRRLAGPLAPSEADERRDEARRFAKLLVSEIKLYNERAVLEGREHGDLYDRLKEDIDRSRQMYDDRIPEDVRANSNFFYEELVRVLADGRADALGME